MTNQTNYELQAAANRANRTNEEIFGHGYKQTKALDAMRENDDERSISEIAEEILQKEK